jgi:ABC-type iron transport system FetAB ATPase subunit
MAGLILQRFQTHHLAPLDLELEPAECVTLSGASGSGKTLLLRAIADLDPHEGEASVDGLQQSRLKAPEWRRRVGLLPAESHWWAPRVQDHFPNNATNHLAALSLPVEALEWEVSRLSSGERQRLALARLLGMQPQVLLLDEPTANLDQTNTLRVEQLIMGYCREQEAAVLWVSHDPQQRQRISSRSYRLTAGRLEEESWN